MFHRWQEQRAGNPSAFGWPGRLFACLLCVGATCHDDPEPGGPCPEELVCSWADAPPPPPSVAANSLELEFDTVYAEGGSQVRLIARAYNGYTQLASTVNVGATWTSEGHQIGFGEALGDDPKSPITISRKEASPHHWSIMTLPEVETRTDVAVTVSVSGKSPASLVVVIAPKVVGATAVADFVRSAHVPGDPPSIVLFDARFSGTGPCVQDRALAVAGLAALADNAMDGCPGSGSQWTVMSPSAALRHPSAVPNPWTDGWGDVLDTSAGTSSPVLSMPVQVRIHTAPTVQEGTVTEYMTEADLREELVTLVKEDVDRASRDLAFNRAGVRWEVTSVVPNGKQAGKFDWTRCGDLDYLDEQFGIDLDDPVVVVVLVEWMVADGRGYACDQLADRAGRLVVLSRTDRYPTTISHETGHVLSLLNPPLAQDGHAPDGNDYQIYNLMRTGVGLDKGGNRHLYSLGQVFRLAVHGNSWVNHGADPVRDGPTRPCKAEADVHCPSVDYHPFPFGSP